MSHSVINLLKLTTQIMVMSNVYIDTHNTIIAHFKKFSTRSLQPILYHNSVRIDRLRRLSAELCTVCFGNIRQSQNSEECNEVCKPHFSFSCLSCFVFQTVQHSASLSRANILYGHNFSCFLDLFFQKNTLIPSIFIIFVKLGTI